MGDALSLTLRQPAGGRRLKVAEGRYQSDRVVSKPTQRKVAFVAENSTRGTGLVTVINCAHCLIRRFLFSEDKNRLLTDSTAAAL